MYAKGYVYSRIQGNLCHHIRTVVTKIHLQDLPGESKKVSAFGGLWNKKYVIDIQN